MPLLREETPPYKLEKFGTAHLADVELIAVLIGGNADKAAEKARTVLASLGSLRQIGRVSVSDLLSLGLGKTEAHRVVAGLELSRRYNLVDVESRPRLNSSRDAFEIIAPLLKDLHHEEFWLLLLNKANEVFDRVKMSSGGQAGTVVDIKLVFREALVKRAAGIIAVHNHPSGNLQPSQADIDLTKRLKKSGETMDIILLDHLIVSERGFYSFADESMM